MKLRSLILVFLLANVCYAPPISLPLHIAPQSQTQMSDRVRNGGQSDMAAVPWGSQTEIDRSAFGVDAVADGVALTGDRPIIRRCDIHHWRGAGIKNTQFDGVIDGTDSHDNYIGAFIPSSDYSISNSQFYNCRDACMWVDAGSGSANVRSTNNHFYGARIACYVSGSRFFRSVNDVFADAYIGCYLGINVSGCNSCTITNALSQHCTVRDYIFRGSRISLVNSVTAIGKAVNEVTGVTIPDHGSNVLTRLVTTGSNKKVGIELGDKCSIIGGHVLLDTFVHPAHTASGAPCEAIWVMNDSHSVRIETYLEDAQGINGAVGIRFKGAHRNPKVDIHTDGFHGAASRIIIFDNPGACKGLDITIRVDGVDAVTPKTINDYIDIGTGWTGLPIRMINGTTGVETEIAPGAAGFMFRHRWQEQAPPVYQLAA